MLEIIKGDGGDIIGVCEYFIVDQKGHLDDNGEYCWIAETELSKSAEHKGYLREMVRLVIAKVPNCRFGYFWRKQKYESRPPHIYSRREWMNLIKEK